MLKKWLAILVAVWGMVISCSSLSLYPTATPLPGWGSPVAELFVGTPNLPSGWRADPNEDAADVRANHVSRTFFDSNPNRSDKVIQDIWRAYTAAEAEEKFNELAQVLVSPGWLPRFPSTSFGPVSEVAYQSKVADKWGVACGIDVIAECRFLALYHNYVTQVYFTLQFEGFEGLDSTGAEELLAGVEGQFRDYLRLPETTPHNPSYLSLIPTPSYNTETGINIEGFFVGTEALPRSWEIAFKDWTGVTNLASGEILASRNYYRNECYLNSPHLARCYITQFVDWYPSIRDAIEEWQRKYSEINVGEPAQLGVWRIPGDITFADAGADQSFVACSEVAGGENCEAILRFGNYLIALMAEMRSLTTLMGHSRYGLTHPEFAQVVEKTAAQARSVLDTVK